VVEPSQQYPSGHTAKATEESTGSTPPQWLAVAEMMPEVHTPPGGHGRQLTVLLVPAVPLLSPDSRE
jgi:hypothetical protein